MQLEGYEVAADAGYTRLLSVRYCDMFSTGSKARLLKVLAKHSIVEWLKR